MTSQTEHSRLRLSVRVLAPVVLGALVLLAWNLAVTSGVPPTLLPAPGDVGSRFAADLASGSLLAYAGVTVAEALLGCALAAAIALPLGWLIARAHFVEAALSPYLAASQAVPAVAIAPLLVIWVGYGLLPIMFLCALLVFFPVVLATTLGLRTIDPEVREAAQLDGARGLRLLRFIEWPLALPAVLTGLRNGFTLSVTGAVVGELVMGGQGLGMVLSVQSASVDTTGLFATLLMLCLIAIAIYMVLVVVEWFSNPLRPVRVARSRQRVPQGGIEELKSEFPLSTTVNRAFLEPRAGSVAGSLTQSVVESPARSVGGSLTQSVGQLRNRPASQSPATSDHASHRIESGVP